MKDTLLILFVGVVSIAFGIAIMALPFWGDKTYVNGVTLLLAEGFGIVWIIGTIVTVAKTFMENDKRKGNDNETK